MSSLHAPNRELVDYSEPNPVIHLRPKRAHVVALCGKPIRNTLPEVKNIGMSVIYCVDCQVEAARRGL